MKKYRHLLAAASLIGDDVMSQDGEKIGKMEELMISVEDGRVGYAVMSFGGFLGFGNKFFAIPWATLRVDEEKKCFILNVDKERLKKAPGFDKDHWPDMTPEWAAEINTYYKFNP